MPRNEPAPPAGEFDGPRRPGCPWCGGRRLRPRPPGSGGFLRRSCGDVLDRCEDCGHCFRSPPPAPGEPAPADGGRFGRAGAAAAGWAGAARHRAAVRALLRFGEPESWLDVGTRSGAFPAAARQAHPYIAFDGLDPGAEVEQALAEGRIDEAHRGTLGALAPRLAGRYDVVSMFHHLADSPDPRAELRAACAVLRPGGHLLVETQGPPGRGAALPARRPGRGRYRACCLHLFPPRNLRRGLEDLGLTVVAAERRTVLAEFAGPAGPGRLLTPLLHRAVPADGYRFIARKDPAG